jgi:predicted nucleic acid-binding protein
MILDTTYVLPLAKIAVDTDVLLAKAQNKTTVRLDEITISLISLFELHAKAAKLHVPAEAVSDSLGAILENFEVYPFSEPKVIKLSFELKNG